MFQTKSSHAILTILNNFTQIASHNLLWKILIASLIDLFLRGIDCDEAAIMTQIRNLLIEKKELVCINIKTDNVKI